VLPHHLLQRNKATDLWNYTKVPALASSLLFVLFQHSRMMHLTSSDVHVAYLITFLYPMPDNKIRKSNASLLANYFLRSNYIQNA
jgi:hypothetical protein